MKRIVIMGGTSGIGYDLVALYLAQGWKVGVAGRRQEILQKIKKNAPNQVEVLPLDVTQPDAPVQLDRLIRMLGGMDLYLHCSGIGSQNATLNPDIELNTVATNVDGFVRLVGAAFAYFKERGEGHIAVISSIAGTKGLGLAPAYSASKRFQNSYIEALEQLCVMERLNIRFTDLRPGFVATPLLKGDHYPLLMQSHVVAQQIVKAITQKEHVRVIDGRYALIVFFWQLIPRWLWRHLPVRHRRGG